MSDRQARSGLGLIVIVAIVAVADAAMYKQVFEKFGTTVGTAFMVVGSLFVIGCLVWMERRR
jgi:hypothetical protein